MHPELRERWVPDVNEDFERTRCSSCDRWHRITIPLRPHRAAPPDDCRQWLLSVAVCHDEDTCVERQLRYFLGIPSKHLNRSWISLAAQRVARSAPFVVDPVGVSANLAA